MKKVILAIGLYCSMLHGAKAQQNTMVPDANSFKKKTLKFEEANIVSGYYFQDGNNSAVTGGRGTERLTDLANSFDITFSKLDRYNRLHTINVDFNIDRYTSASSDNIDSLTRSSASKTDTHIYPSINWSVKDDASRTTKSFGYAYSTEYDYQSHGVNGGITLLSKDKNTEYSLKGSIYLDKYMCILPAELRPADYPSGAETDRFGIAFRSRNSYAATFSIAQVINQRLQIMGIVEPGFQEGLLSTPFHRVYFNNGNKTTEKLPSTRLKLPIGLRVSYFGGDKLVVRGFYRFYVDDWGMVAHTANLEIPYKVSPFFSVMPFYRINNQSGVKYFKKYAMHSPTENYYTSDFDLSSFISEFLGVGIRMAPPGGIANLVHWNSMELRYGYYHRSNGMVGHSVSLQIKIK